MSPEVPEAPPLEQGVPEQGATHAATPVLELRFHIHPRDMPTRSLGFDIYPHLSVEDVARQVEDYANLMRAYIYEELGIALRRLVAPANLGNPKESE